MYNYSYPGTITGWNIHLESEEKGSVSQLGVHYSRYGLLELGQIDELDKEIKREEETN